MLRTFNFNPTADVDAVVAAAAMRLVGKSDAPALIEAWRLCDTAVRGFPSIMLYDKPRIDPDFMWRLPPSAGLDPKVYLKY